MNAEDKIQNTSELVTSFIHLFLYCQQMSKRIRHYIWLKHITIMLLGK